MSASPSTVPFDAGARDKWVTIEAKTATRTTSGYPGSTWATLATVAMSRKGGAADERITSAQPAAMLTFTWGCPYRPDMDPDLVDVPTLRRLLYRGRRYDIKAAELIGRRRGVELLTIAASGVPTQP